LEHEERVVGETVAAEEVIVLTFGSAVRHASG
jgi:hypothetical protein